MRKILFLLPIIILSSCMFSSKTFKFTSDHPDYYWHKGRQMLKQEIDDLNLVLNFSRVDRGKIFFDTNFLNKSDNSVLVTPDSIKCLFIDESGDTTVALAINPEEIIDNLDKKAQRETADNNCSECLDAGMCFFEVADTFQDHKKTPQELEEAEESRRERAENTEHRRAEYKRTMKEIESHRKFFSETALRKTTLAKNESISGKVLFNFPYDTVKLYLTLKIEDKIFEFIFNKVIPEPEKRKKKYSKYPRD